MRNNVLACLTAAGCLYTSAAAAVISFGDTEFAPDDWSVTSQVVAGSGPLSFTATQVASGGNPGAYREMTHTWSNGTRGVIYHLQDAATYDPSVLGAIESIDYAEDARTDNFPGGGLALLQDGVLYAHIGRGFTNGDWETFSVDGLVASDFFRQDGVAGAPDLTDLGSEIVFGFWRSNTITGQLTLTNSIDNWSVALNQADAIPLPAGAILFASGLGGAMAMRRRAARA